MLIPLGLFLIGSVPVLWLSLSMGLPGSLPRSAIARSVPAACGFLLLLPLGEHPHWEIGQGYRPTLRIAFVVLLAAGAVSRVLSAALLRVAARDANRWGIGP